jgi:hypothetical protein
MKRTLSTLPRARSAFSTQLKGGLRFQHSRPANHFPDGLVALAFHGMGRRPTRGGRPTDHGGTMCGYRVCPQVSAVLSPSAGVTRQCGPNKGGRHAPDRFGGLRFQASGARPARHHRGHHCPGIGVGLCPDRCLSCSQQAAHDGFRSRFLHRSGRFGTSALEIRVSRSVHLRVSCFFGARRWTARNCLFSPRMAESPILSAISGLLRRFSQSGPPSKACVRHGQARRVAYFALL